MGPEPGGGDDVRGGNSFRSDKREVFAYSLTRPVCVSQKSLRESHNMTDPFLHHPELRDLVKPCQDSFFRTITTDIVRAQIAQSGQPLTINFHDETTREGLRAQALKGHTGDLYIFAYGSLMWDPAIEFTEVRRALAPGHERRFILVDNRGGRGTSDSPGLMAALDEGQGCDGLVFRIAADAVDAETEILFRREMIAPGYLARFVPVVVDGTDAMALTFVADHAQAHMRRDISRNDQIRFAATGSGILGSSLDYLKNTVEQLEKLGITDPDASDLLRAALAYGRENC